MERTKTLKRWDRGVPISARQLNEGVDEINRLGRGVNAPRQKESDSKSRAGVIAQFKIVSLNDNYLVCNRFDGVQPGREEIKIAKPTRLRNEQSWNGINYTYTGFSSRQADNGSDTEAQVVVPAYIVGDIVYAISPIKGGVNVSVGNENLDWLDLNVDARTWAREQPS